MDIELDGAILEETVESIVRRRPDLDPARLRRRMVFAEADVIVTDNVRDFPPNVAPRFEIAVRTADDFLVELWRRNSRTVAGVIVEQSEGTHRPHIEPRPLIDALGRVVPQFARRVADSPEFGDELARR